VSRARQRPLAGMRGRGAAGVSPWPVVNAIFGFFPSRKPHQRGGHGVFAVEPRLEAFAWRLAAARELEQFVAAGARGARGSARPILEQDPLLAG